MTDVEEKRDFRAEAEKLCASVSGLQRKLLIKHTAAVLSEIYAQITQRDSEIERLTKTVGTLIGWLQIELGAEAAKELLTILEAP